MLPFLTSNLTWKFRNALFTSNLCAILDNVGQKILNLEKTCFVIGDIYYAHETLLTILLLFKNKRTFKRQ